MSWHERLPLYSECKCEPLSEAELDELFERYERGDDFSGSEVARMFVTLDRATSEGDGLHARLLRWRDVRDPCEKCAGSGQRMYGSTATWRGGVGGCVTTRDVCDVCWGTGDRYHTGCDLRRLRDEESKRTAEQAVDLLARSCAATFKTSQAQVYPIVDTLEKFADKRGQHYMVAALSQGLANTLRRALGIEERKEHR